MMCAVLGLQNMIKVAGFTHIYSITACAVDSARFATFTLVLLVYLLCLRPLTIFEYSHKLQLFFLKLMLDDYCIYSP